MSTSNRLSVSSTLKNDRPVTLPSGRRRFATSPAAVISPVTVTIGMPVVACRAAIGFFHFWICSRFWFPRYVHYLGAFALALGLACLACMPPEAPINQGAWGGLKKALLVL